MNKIFQMSVFLFMTLLGGLPGCGTGDQPYSPLKTATTAPQGRSGENIGAWTGVPVELGPRKAPHRIITG